MQRPENLSITMSFDYGDIEISFKLKGLNSRKIIEHILEKLSDVVDYDFDDTKGSWITLLERDGLRWSISEVQGIKLWVMMDHYNDFNYTKPPTLDNLDNFLEAVNQTRRVLHRIDEIAAAIH